jgi:hypothetical protein
MKYTFIYRSFIIAFTVISLNIGCTGKSENKEKIENKVSQIEIKITESIDSLKDNWTLSKSEFIEIKHDTLVIASFDIFLYYPFGKIKNVESLNQKLYNLQPQIISFDYLEDIAYPYRQENITYGNNIHIYTNLITSIPNLKV